jgi:hypothetical protein
MYVLLEQAAIFANLTDGSMTFLWRAGKCSDISDLLEIHWLSCLLRSSAACLISLSWIFWKFSVDAKADSVSPLHFPDRETSALSVSASTKQVF